MKTSYLEFIDLGRIWKKKTNIYSVKNKISQEVIGYISWARNFRKYAFFPNNETYYDSKCLKEIAEYLMKLMEVKESEATK